MFDQDLLRLRSLLPCLGVGLVDTFLVIHQVHLASFTNKLHQHSALPKGDLTVKQCCCHRVVEAKAAFCVAVKKKSTLMLLLTSPDVITISTGMNLCKFAPAMNRN